MIVACCSHFTHCDYCAVRVLQFAFLGLYGPEFGTRWGRYFPYQSQIGPNGHPASCKMRTGKLTWGHSGLGMTLTTHLISAEVKESLAPYLYITLRLHGVS